MEILRRNLFGLTRRSWKTIEPFCPCCWLGRHCFPTDIQRMHSVSCLTKAQTETEIEAHPTQRRTCRVAKPFLGIAIQIQIQSLLKFNIVRRQSSSCCGYIFIDLDRSGTSIPTSLRSRLTHLTPVSEMSNPEKARLPTEDGTPSVKSGIEHSTAASSQPPIEHPPLSTTDGVETSMSIYYKSVMCS